MYQNSDNWDRQQIELNMYCVTAQRLKEGINKTVDIKVGDKLEDNRNGLQFWF